MKIFKTIIISGILLGLFQFAHTQGTDKTINNIVTAIKNANSNTLAEYFNTTLDIEIDDIDDRFSKTQSEMIIRDFFKNSPPVSFTLNHQGSSDDGSRYMIGTYKTTSKNYRVYILLKLVDKKSLIHQIQFEVN